MTEIDVAKTYTKRNDFKGTVALFKQYDAGLWETWGSYLEKATEVDELDARARAVLRVALDSIIHWSLPVIEYDINAALDAGSNVAEIIEATVAVGNLEGGVHSIHDALEGLEMVVQAREKAGKPVPMVGDPLKPDELIHEAPWPVPPVWKMHTPNPRWHTQVLMKWAPEIHEGMQANAAARARGRKGLTERMAQLLTTTIDVAIIWPDPLLDHHMHAAFEAGCTRQELLEAVVFSSTSCQGAMDSSLSAHVPGGFVAMHHGVTALERVMIEREGSGVWAPIDKNSPRVGNPTLTPRV